MPRLSDTSKTRAQSCYTPRKVEGQGGKGRTQDITKKRDSVSRPVTVNGGATPKGVDGLQQSAPKTALLLSKQDVPL